MQILIKIINNQQIIKVNFNLIQLQHNDDLLCQLLLQASDQLTIIQQLITNNYNYLSSRSTQIQMFSVIIVVLQVVYLIFIAAFMRASSVDVSNGNFIIPCFALLLAFSLMYTPYRKLSLFSLVMLLLVISISIQTNILFGTFWDKCFTYFSTQTQMSATLITKSTFAALTVLITCLDFIGLFEYWQVYLIIAPIMTIGYGLCSSIIVYGLDVYDGGGGLTVFLYSGVCSVMIWLISIRGKISITKFKKSESYINYTLAFIGVMIALISWPQFNMAGATLSYLNTNLSSSDSLQSCAFINTLLALSVSLLSSFMLASKDSKQQKMKPKVFIQCFINAGIITASYNDLSLHPVAGMVLVLFSTILTLILDRYLFKSSQTQTQFDLKMIAFKYSKIFFRIIFSFLGVCISAIVVATRSSQTPSLLTNNTYSNKAGLQIVAFFIVFVISAIFGLFSAISINVMIAYKHSSTQVAQKSIKIIDEHFFEGLQQQIFPIYRDIFQSQPQKKYQQDLTRRVLHQTIQKSVLIPMQVVQKKKNPYQTSASPRDMQKQTLVIRNDFSRINTNPARNVNVSTMKIRQLKQDISKDFDQIRQSQNKPLAPSQMKIQHSNIKVFEQTEIKPQQKPNIIKKLTYSDVDSQIQNQNAHKNKPND